MKTQNISPRLFLFSLFTFLTSNLFAGNYTWTGSTSADWATSTNWSPNGNPSTNDTVTLVHGSNDCKLASNTTVKRLVVSSGTFNLKGYLFTANDINVTGGTLTNGSLTGNSTMSFGGGIVDVTVDVTGTSILFNGSVFNYPVSATYKGTSTSTGTGRNIFNSTLTLIDSGSGSWSFAGSSPDTCLDVVSVTNTSSGTIYLAHNSMDNYFSKTTKLTNTSSGIISCAYYQSVTFNDSLLLNNTGSGQIQFGRGSGTITAPSFIGIGSSGLSSSGVIDFQGVLQTGSSQNISLTGSGTSSISFGPRCVFDGNITANAPALSLDGSRFNKKAILTHTGNLTTNCKGNCIFGDSTWIYHSNSSGGAFNLATVDPDSFNKPVTIENSDRGKIVVTRGIFSDNTIFIDNSPFSTSGGVTTPTSTSPYSFYVGDGNTCTFYSSLTLKSDSGDIAFGTSHGSVQFQSASSLKIDSSYFGSLFLSNVDYSSTTGINIPFQSNSRALFLDTNNVFDAKLNCSVQHVQLNGTTFNDTLILKTINLDSDTSKGGNIFNGYTVFIDSNVIANKAMVLARNYTDDFNGPITFKQYGKGKIYPSHTKNSTFSGDITVDADSTVYFGYAGGRVIIDGGNANSFTNSGSGQPQIKKMEMKKTDETFLLKGPMTISDSLFFTKGFFVADSLRPLIIPDNGIVSGASDSSFVIGLVNKIGNDSFIFPLGNKDDSLGYYHPLSISAPANSTDAFTAEYIFGSHGLTTDADSTIENESLCEYWKVNRLSGSSKVKVGLGWNSNSCNVYGLDSMQVAVWDTATLMWKDKGNAGTTGNLTVGTVLSLDSISKFGSVITLADKFCTTLKNNIIIQDVNCYGSNNGTAKVTSAGATSPYSYIWSNGLGMNKTAISLVAGNYILLTIDSRNCIVSDTVKIEQPDPIIINISTSNSVCGDSTGSAIATPSGGIGPYTYVWSNFGEIDSTVDSLAAGDYTVHIVDSVGCIGRSSVNISDSDGPSVSVNILSEVLCPGASNGSASLSVSGGISPYTFLWTTTGDTDTVVYDLRAGEHSILITDSVGCKTFVSATISQPDSFFATITSTSSSCSSNTGTATITPSGGTLPYTYVWSSAGTDSTEINLSSGKYSVIVTDSAGCTISDSIFITNLDAPEISFHLLENISCFDSSDGQGYLTLTGGTAPYSFMWLPDSLTNDTANNLFPGEHTVIVTDANGCKQIDTIFIKDPPRLQVSIYGNNPSSISISDGSLGVYVTGGTPPYSYSWSPGGSTSDFISGLGLGSDTVLVTDNNGCSVQANKQLSRFGCTPTCDQAHDPACSLYVALTPPHANVTKSILDFGADNTGTYSSECAFEAARDFFQGNTINGIGGNGTLLIPSGIYKVGYQYHVGDWYLKGHDVLCFNNVTAFHITGVSATKDRPIIMFNDCLKYGSFDPVSGDRWLGGDNTCLIQANPTDDSHNCYLCASGGCTTCLVPNTTDPLYLPCCVSGPAFYSIAAFPGNLIQFENSNWCWIENLDLDGNINNMSIGGGFGGDGIQLAYDGIFLNSCYNTFIKNSYVHHFGRDGIQIADAQCPYTGHADGMGIALLNSKFNWNGRSEMSWIGGQAVSAYNCDFDWNAMGRIYSKNADGLDIEWQPGQGPIKYGFWKHCNFRFNGACAIECQADAPNGFVHLADNFEFQNCTFVSSESSYTMMPNARGFYFNTLCHIHGNVCRIYDDEDCSWCPDNGNAKFEDVNFYEDYPATGPTANRRSHNLNPIDEPCLTPVCSPSHSWVVELDVSNPASRAEFTRCKMYTNYSANWGLFWGRYSPNPNSTKGSYNYLRMDYFRFYSAGVNAYCCDVHNLIQMGYVLFRNNQSEFHYPLPGLVNPPNGGCGTAFYDGIIYTYAGIYPNQSPTESHIYCAPKFTNYHDVSPENLFGNCASCVTILPDSCPGNPSPPCIEPPCGEEERIAERSIEKFKKPSLFPNPSLDIITVSDIYKGDEIIIYNSLGKQLFKILSNSTSIEIHLGNLNSGIYFLSVNGITMDKFIKVY